MHKSKNQYAIQRNKEEHEHGEIVCKLLDIVNFLSDEVSKKNDSSFLSLPQKYVLFYRYFGIFKMYTVIRVCYCLKLVKNFVII